jgi:TP901-1 family phage major tail protein
MAAQKGSALLLKSTPTGGSETTIAGLRSTSMTINGEMVDITTKDSDALVSGGVTKARELLQGGGVSNMSISASGVFTDSALENDIRVRAQKGQIDTYKLVFGDGDNITGSFQITSYERAGEYNGEETYSLTLESSGQVTHTSA